MKKMVVLMLCFVSPLGDAHHPLNQNENSLEFDTGKVTYLGNAGLLVEQGDLQLLFDPFFHNHYGHYQLVPDDIRQAIFAGESPFESVEMILISHAHEDHFDANDLVKYLKKNPATKLLAPQQAVDQMQDIDGFSAIQAQITGIDLAYQQSPKKYNLPGIEVDVIRIPHAGWPERAEVSNLVYRVHLDGVATVMHMGDADPDDAHFEPWSAYWQSRKTDRAYPPYWFMLTPSGQEILANRVNTEHATGVHVPVKVPAALQQSGADFFSTTGSSHTIHSNHKKNKQ